MPPLSCSARKPADASTSNCYTPSGQLPSRHWQLSQRPTNLAPDNAALDSVLVVRPAHPHRAHQLVPSCRSMLTGQGQHQTTATQRQQPLSLVFTPMTLTHTHTNSATSAVEQQHLHRRVYSRKLKTCQRVATQAACRVTSSCCCATACASIPYLVCKSAVVSTCTCLIKQA